MLTKLNFIIEILLNFPFMGFVEDTEFRSIKNLLVISTCMTTNGD